MANKLTKLTMLLTLLSTAFLGLSLTSGEVENVSTPTKTAVSYTTSEDLNDHDTNHSSDYNWTSLQNTNASTGGILTGGDNESAMAYYYLEYNVELSSSLNISNYVTLCLNGKKLYGNGNDSVIKVAGNTNYLNLCDCSSNNSGIIIGGEAEEGAGVLVSSYATFNMYGGTISGNESDYDGGGVFVSGYSTFNMYGGEISNNTANAGGGVGVADGTFSMFGGTISNNKALNLGGGVFVYDGVTFNMYGGTITNNTAQSSYSSVYGRQFNFNMYGGYLGGDGVQADAFSNISITGGYLSSDAHTSVRGYIPNGYNADNTGDDTWPYIVVEDSHSDIVDDKPAVFVTYLDEVSYKNYTTLTLSNGSYYLATDLNLDVTISGTVYLCLNGKTLEGTGTTSVITVSINANFNLCDCSDDNSGVVTGGNANSGCGVNVASYATLNMYGGSISNNTTSNNDGAGVYMLYSTFNMYGGLISNNTTSTGNGAGVCMVYSTFNMHNGIISNNTTSNGDGGGVYMTYSTFKMYDGTISNNTAARRGAGVCLASQSTFDMQHGYLGDDVNLLISNSNIFISGGYLSETVKSSIQDSWLYDEANNQYIIISIQEGDGDFEYKEGYPYAVVSECGHYRVTYSPNATTNKHDSTCSNCGAAGSYDHYSTSSEYERYDTYHTQECDACSTEFTESHTYVYDSGETSSHTAKCECSATVDHNSYKLDYDSSGHYYVCAEDVSCSYQSDPMNHNMSEWTAFDETTEESKCDVCEYTETRPISVGSDDNQGGGDDGNNPSDGEGDTGDTGASNDDGDTGSTTTPNDDGSDTGSTTTPNDDGDTGSTTTPNDDGGDTTTSSDSTGLSAGVISGIVIGSVLVACLIAFAVYFFVFRKHDEKGVDE